MKNIILVQHTQSLHHTNGMIGSWTDWELSDLGKHQADLMGKRLAEQLGGVPYVIFSSDLMRAKQTADLLGKHLNVKPQFKEALRERNLGSAVGKSVQWLHENQVPFQDTVDHRCVIDAETRREVWQRLIPFYEEVLNRTEENIIIVSHGDTLSIFCAMWLKLEVADLNEIDLFGMAGGVSFLYETKTKKRLIKRLSDMSYIKE